MKKSLLRASANIAFLLICVAVVSSNSEAQKGSKPTGRNKTAVSSIDPAKNYRIVSAYSILALALTSESATVGQPLITQPYQNEPWRRWRIVALPLEGGQQFYQVLSVRSGLVMASSDPNGGNPVVPVTQELWNNSDSQKWMIEDAESGRVRFKRKGSGKYLIVRDNDPSAQHGDAPPNPASLYDSWILVEEPITTLTIKTR